MKAIKLGINDSLRLSTRMSLDRNRIPDESRASSGPAQENGARPELPALQGAWRGLCLEKLRFEGEVDVFADQEAAGFEGRVPGKAEVLAIDFGRGGDADAGVAPGVFAGSGGAFYRKSDRLGDAVDSEVAGNGIFGLALALDAGGL